MLKFFLFRPVVLPMIAAMLSVVLTGSRCGVPTDEEVMQPSVEIIASQAPQSGFILVELEKDAIFKGDLVLVSNAAPCRFTESQDLVSVAEGMSGSYFIRSLDLMLTPDALTAVNNMMDEFLTQGGSKTVNLVAAWRSEETQQRLYDNSAARNGVDHARRFVALPGCSEHHTGLAIDFSLYFPDGTSADFTAEGEYARITEACRDHGLIVRYTEEKESLTGIAAEPWHFRYVGVPHAQKMAELNFCLEEYLDYLRTFPFDGDHLFIDCAAGQYEIWYEKGSAIHLPVEGEYTVSGDNMSGMIVTRKLLDGDFSVRYTKG